MSMPSWVQRPRDQPPSSEPWETIPSVRDPQASRLLPHKTSLSPDPLSPPGCVSKPHRTSSPKMAPKRTMKHPLVLPLLVGGGQYCQITPRRKAEPQPSHTAVFKKYYNPSPYPLTPLELLDWSDKTLSRNESKSPTLQINHHRVNTVSRPCPRVWLANPWPVDLTNQAPKLPNQLGAHKHHPNSVLSGVHVTGTKYSLTLYSQIILITVHPQRNLHKVYATRTWNVNDLSE